MLGVFADGLNALDSVPYGHSSNIPPPARRLHGLNCSIQFLWSLRSAATANAAAYKELNFCLDTSVLNLPECSRPDVYFDPACLTGDGNAIIDEINLAPVTNSALPRASYPHSWAFQFFPCSFCMWSHLGMRQVPTRLVSSST